MPLCDICFHANTPWVVYPLVTFQSCIMSIFSDFVEDTLEVFKDDFSIVGDSFDDCLKN